MKPITILLTAGFFSLYPMGHAGSARAAAGSDADQKVPATAPPNALASYAPERLAEAAAVQNIGVEEFEKLRGDKHSVVLDVRTPKEFAAGHITGALNIDWNAPDFLEKISGFDKNKTYLVHCAAGGRSAKACDKMGQLNFQHLYNLLGGFKAWEKAGKPVEK